MTAPSTRTTGNLFLDHLPERALEALWPSLERTSLKRGHVVFDGNEPIRTVLFPLSSIVSVVVEMLNGETAEVGVIGREGMTGLSIVLGMDSSNQRAVIQVPDAALCTSAAAFHSALERSAQLRASSLRYAQASMMTGAQLSACNTLHSTNERCARWLLMAHDRSNADSFLLTQEFLSQMLGVRRTGVTLAASAMQEAGFISYARGHVTIRNRPGLESAACECYEAIERGWQQIMGYAVRKRPAAV